TMLHLQPRRDRSRRHSAEHLVVDGTRQRGLWAVDSWDQPGARPSPARARRRRRKLAARYRRRRLVALTIAVVTIAWFFTVIHTGARPQPARVGSAAAGHALRVLPPAPRTPVRPGTHGTAVTGLQTALAALGATTRRAVARFQRSHGLAADGAAASPTVAALARALAAAAASSASQIRA